MYVEIDLAAGLEATIALREPEEFRSFAVSVIGAGQREAELASALERLGRREDSEHVLVAVPVLEALAGPLRFDPRWRAGLESMLAYARRCGWIDPDGRVRAHIA
jgi:hypothetical protein